MMHDHYDEFGNSRTYSGQINNYYGASTAEQREAGVGHHDSWASANAKVQTHRSDTGPACFNAAPLPPPSYGGAYLDYSSPSSAEASRRVLKAVLWVAILLLTLFALLVAWQATTEQRKAYAPKVLTWALERSLGSAELAPISAYAAFGPHGAPPALSAKETEPGALAKKAHALSSKANGDKQVSDKNLAKWGFAAWSCLSQNPECLAAAKASGNDPDSLRTLGLLFLDYASRNGSPDAEADFGLYVVRHGGPWGKDLYLARSRWQKGAENPKASRSRELLDSTDSLWLTAGRYAAKILRADLRP